MRLACARSLRIMRAPFEEPVMIRKPLLLMPFVFVFAIASANESNEKWVKEVRDTETAFAATMAKRDLAAFSSFLAEEAVFFGPAPLRGKAAVIEAWKGFYEGPNAPFSWRPETVEVLASGTLAHSSGPVLDPRGEKVGTFNSIWRRESDGHWKIVFDKGGEACACKESKLKE
jgi:ketosteroid isomerase-like protein